MSEGTDGLGATPDDTETTSLQRPTSVDPLLPTTPPPPAIPSWSSPSAPLPPAPPPAGWAAPPSPDVSSYPPPVAAPTPGAWQGTAPMGAPGQPAWSGAALPGVAGWGAVPQAPKPGVIPLRPLGLGEILDGSVSYARRDPKTVLGISLVISLVLALSQFLALLGLDNALGSLESTGTGSNPIDPASAIGSAASLLAATFGQFVLSFVLNIIAVGMLTVVMSQAVLGRRVSARDARNRTRSRFWALIGVTLMVALVVGLAGGGGLILAILLGVLLGNATDGAVGFLVGTPLVLAAIAAGVWLSIRLLLAPVALILENVGVIASMRRSAALVKGAWWRTFGIYLLTSIIAYIVGQVLTIPFGFVGIFATASSTDASLPLAVTALSAVGILVSSTVTIPFTAGVVSLLYIDRRIRREALDLELQRAAGVGG